MPSLLILDIEIAKLDNFDTQDYESHRSENPNFDFGVETNKIVCVSIISSKEWLIPRSIIGDERDIIFETMDLISNHDEVVGYNILAFDIPFIAKRAIINNLRLCSPLKAFNKKPWDVGYIIDLMVIWKHWSQKACTLDLLCRSLNIPTPKDGINGSMVDQYFRDGHIKEIAEYCEKDVIATAKVYNHFKSTNLI